MIFTKNTASSTEAPPNTKPRPLYQPRVYRLPAKTLLANVWHKYSSATTASQTCVTVRKPLAASSPIAASAVARFSGKMNWLKNGLAWLSTIKSGNGARTDATIKRMTAAATPDASQRTAARLVVQPNRSAHANAIRNSPNVSRSNNASHEVVWELA